MLGWLVRMLLVVSSSITSLFISRDVLNFSIFKMVIAVLLFTLFVFIVAFWPSLVNLFRREKKEKDN
ncbi:hypothetical protein [Legionella drozanskii]|uniref:Uncharacterized protein n=1 Tax=Legionella drozanskii LLAP-1 TaxID=1212489 RepID=A0A0W0SQX4_9GAMM|nr:hypothetical protein [Legionella drozanskii]KTC85649.1 hypothetical protein Ldro_1974 [Legionella drozanskii LLAP-1]